GGRRRRGGAHGGGRRGRLGGAGRRGRGPAGDARPGAAARRRAAGRAARSARLAGPGRAAARRGAGSGGGGAVIRVLIADDQAATREGLRLLLSGEPDVEVAAEAADGFEAVSQAGVHRPDVVLLDVRMPRMDGLAAIGRLLRLDPSPAIIVLTTFDLDEYLFGALRAGAAGFLLKDGDPDLFVRAIRAAHGGQGL